MAQNHAQLQFFRKSSHTVERIHADVVAEYDRARFEIDPEERRAPARALTTCAFGNFRIHQTTCIGGEMSGEPRDFLAFGVTMRGGLSIKTPPLREQERPGHGCHLGSPE